LNAFVVNTSKIHGSKAAIPHRQSFVPDFGRLLVPKFTGNYLPCLLAVIIGKITSTQKDYQQNA
jgi:hypothetical protein